MCGCAILRRYDFDRPSTGSTGSTFAPAQTDVFPQRYPIVCPSFRLCFQQHITMMNNFKLDDKKEKLERSAIVLHMIILCTIIYPEVSPISDKEEPRQ